VFTAAPGTATLAARSSWARVTPAALAVEVLDGTRAIERYDPARGALLGTSDVAAGDALALSGRTPVYAAGRQVEAMDATTGARQVLAVSPAPPIGVSVAGKRVAWRSTCTATVAFSL